MKCFSPWRFSHLKWIIRHRAWNRYYLVRYLRFLKLHHFGAKGVMCTGFVFLGRGVELSAREGYGRILLEPWVHIGDQCHIRAHEGTIRIGSKTVMGRDNTINAYLDISIGSECVISDSIYMCDFDHRFSNISIPIRDQGIHKTPVRIGDDTWIGTKVSILRGSDIGAGCVIGAHSVVRGVIAPMSVAVGIPAKVIKSRLDVDATQLEIERHSDSVRLRTRAALNEISGKGLSESTPKRS